MMKKIYSIMANPIRKYQGIQCAKKLMISGKKLKLDIGCGANKREGFIGLDLSPHSDIQWDLKWGLPFDNDSIIEIRSDHCFEHLDLPLVLQLLQECRRVLISGGILDFTVPHIDPYINAYLRKDFEFLKEKIDDIPPEQVSLYNTCFDRISWLLYRDGEHKSLFDQDAIISKVKLAGFQNVTTRSFDPNKDAVCRFSSIYIVAKK